MQRHQTKQLDCQIRFGLPREITVGVFLVAGPRSFVAKGLLGLARPDIEDRCQCVFRWIFGSMPSHLLRPLAVFLSGSLAVWLAGRQEQRGMLGWQAGWLTVLTVWFSPTNPTHPRRCISNGRGPMDMDRPGALGE